MIRNKREIPRKSKYISIFLASIFHELEMIALTSERLISNIKILANGVKKFDLRWWSPIWVEIQNMICTNIIGIKSSFFQCTKHVHCTNNQCSLWTEINVTFHHVLPCHFYAINIFYICFFFSQTITHQEILQLRNLVFSIYGVVIFGPDPAKARSHE